MSKILLQKWFHLTPTLKLNTTNIRMNIAAAALWKSITTNKNERERREDKLSEDMSKQATQWLRLWNGFSFGWPIVLVMKKRDRYITNRWTEWEF